MADKPKLYAIPLFSYKAAGAPCWDLKVCGQGLVGAIDLGDGYGEALPCITPAAECPAFDKEMATAFGTVFDGVDEDRPVFLRKLKAMPKAAP